MSVGVLGGDLRCCDGDRALADGKSAREEQYLDRRKTHAPFYLVTRGIATGMMDSCCSQNAATRVCSVSGRAFNSLPPYVLPTFLQGSSTSFRKPIRVYEISTRLQRVPHARPKKCSKNGNANGESTRRLSPPGSTGGLRPIGSLERHGRVVGLLRSCGAGGGFGHGFGEAFATPSSLPHQPLLLWHAAAYYA